MPAALIASWTAWNEADLGLIRSHLDLAVAESIEWNDPRDSFVGIDELEAAVKRLRSSKPEYVFTIASEIDHHHDRLRDRWDMTRNGRTLMEGLDMATVDPSSGLIIRVHGFFGHPTPVHVDASGVPKRSDPSQPTKQLRRPRRSHIARPEALVPSVSYQRFRAHAHRWAQRCVVARRLVPSA